MLRVNLRVPNVFAICSSNGAVLGQMLAQRVGQRSCAPKKHAAVPEIVSRSHESGCAFGVGFLGKSAHPECSPALPARRFRCSHIRFRREWGEFPAPRYFRQQRRSRCLVSKTRRKRYSSPMTLSEGNIPITACGSLRSRMKAAKPMAGAVFRPTGSATICCLLSRGIWRAISRCES